MEERHSRANPWWHGRDTSIGDKVDTNFDKCSADTNGEMKGFWS